MTFLSSKSGGKNSLLAERNIEQDQTHGGVIEEEKVKQQKIRRGMGMVRSVGSEVSRSMHL